MMRGPDQAIEAWERALKVMAEAGAELWASYGHTAAREGRAVPGSDMRLCVGANQ